MTPCIKVTLLFIAITSAQPTADPTYPPTDPIYDTCWEIESNPPCNDDYYVDNLGCHWDGNDTSCMCRIEDNAINVIYLTDITTYAHPSQAHFADVAHLMQDVTNATLTIVTFNQILLFDQNIYKQTPNIDAETINIDQLQRTSFNNLISAINASIHVFHTLDATKRRVLVIFSGSMQGDYTGDHDHSGVCQLRSVLTNEEITVIIVSYTTKDDTQGGSAQPRDLSCLVSPNSMDAYNEVPYTAITSALPSGWDGFPIEAKLSWDICETAEIISPTAAVTTLAPTSFPTFVPTLDPTHAIFTPIECGETVSDAWDFSAMGEIWFVITVPMGVQRITFDTCSEMTTLNTSFALWDDSATQLLATDDNGCNDTVGRSRLEFIPIASETDTLYRLRVRNKDRQEGTYELSVACVEPTLNPTPTPTLNPIPNPTPNPTLKPTLNPTLKPIQNPTPTPTLKPSDSDTECPVADTNWRLKYKHSFVVQKKKKKNRSRAWWSSNAKSGSDSKSYNNKKKKQKKRQRKSVSGSSRSGSRRRRLGWNQTQRKRGRNSGSDSESSQQKRGWNKNTKLATCLVYDLVVTGENSNECYGNASSIAFWQISVAPKCDGQISLPEIRSIFYYNFPNTFDIVYDDVTHRIGFGKRYENARVRPEIPSVKEYILCFEKSTVNAFETVETQYFIEGSNGYYAKDGQTLIADICKLMEPKDSSDSDSLSSDTKYGWSSKGESKSNSNSKREIWRKPKADQSYECRMEDTNWNLKYKRSYVSQKQKSKTQKSVMSHKGWWAKQERKAKKRRGMGYKYKFSAENEEFYEDTLAEMEIESESALLSCFVYEIECSESGSKCYDNPSKIDSFSLNVPFSACDVSMPELNHAFDWSEPNTFEVVYDTDLNGLAFGLSFENIKDLNIGQKREFKLCFERNELNAYNMVLSTFKIEGENKYYSIDGTIYVPDICQLRIH